MAKDVDEALQKDGIEQLKDSEAIKANNFFHVDGTHSLGST